MVIRSKSRNTNSKTPLGIWILAVASSLALVALVVTLSTPAVHADVLLPRPSAMAPPTPPIASTTPVLQSSQQSVSIRRHDKLHGIATWYGSVFNGRRTASGERFDMFAMTACHPTLPFGTLVRVFNRTNRRSVVVRITDRGDLVKEGRIIDLSYGAAERLAMTKVGIAKVDVEVLALPGSHGKN